MTININAMVSRLRKEAEVLAGKSLTSPAPTEMLLAANALERTQAVRADLKAVAEAAIYFQATVYGLDNYNKAYFALKKALARHGVQQALKD